MSQSLIIYSLAMAEITTLVSAIYRKYSTKTAGDFETVSPGITARYEVFYDETCSSMRVCFYRQFYNYSANEICRNMNVKSILCLAKTLLVAVLP